MKTKDFEHELFWQFWISGEMMMSDFDQRCTRSPAFNAFAIAAQWARTQKASPLPVFWYSAGAVWYMSGPRKPARFDLSEQELYLSEMSDCLTAAWRCGDIKAHARYCRSVADLIAARAEYFEAQR